MPDEIFRISTNVNNYVVQANDLISARQNLSLNATKLLRTVIMNVKADDKELKDYRISLKELSGLLGVPVSDLSRDAKKIVSDIMKHPVEIKQITKNREKWVSIPWVAYVEYDTQTGFTLKLNPLLKEYVLNLKAHYTQYHLDTALRLGTVYSIRLMELIERKHIGKKVPLDGYDVELSCQEIREACACPKSYNTFSNLKLYVIDAALKEINSKTLYYIDYTYIKEGRAVVAIKFHVNMLAHKKIIESGRRAELERKIEELNQKMEERKNG